MIYTSRASGGTNDDQPPLAIAASFLSPCLTNPSILIILATMKQNASLDASFWINAYNADLVEFLPNYFVVFVCDEVASEITYPLDVLKIKVAASPLLFQEWCSSGHITQQNPAKPVDWFHVGENAAIALAIEHGYWLLMDDANPYHMAKSRGLRVVGTADLAVFLYDQEQLTYEQCVQAFERLRSSKQQRRNALIVLEKLARAKGER